MRSENDKILADFQFSEDKEIFAEDFPDAKVKKVILVKEMKKRTIKRA